MIFPLKAEAINYLTRMSPNILSAAPRNYKLIVKTILLKKCKIHDRENQNVNGAC